MAGSAFEARGIVFMPSDFSFPRWPELVAEAGLNVVGFHLGAKPSELVAFLEGKTGREAREGFLERGLAVEYELHAMGELLPRDLFWRDPALFRMDENGQRVPDCNLCPCSGEALEIVGQNAVALSRQLAPTTHRYYYWSDDGMPWCHCPKCEGLNDADQSLLVTNATLRALRAFDPAARLSALAYHGTLQPPTQVRPEEGCFLEFAPIERRWDRPLADRSVEAHGRLLDALDAAIECYGVDEHAQVLEYWMDASRHSGWKRPAVRIPWHPEVLAADLELYASKGFRRVTSFGCYLDQEYVDMYGLPPVAEYGAALAGRATGGR